MFKPLQHVFRECLGLVCPSGVVIGTVYYFPLASQNRLLGSVEVTELL